MNDRFKLSPKSLDFLKSKAHIDILEGTARSAKSTNAMLKLGLTIERSSYNQFFISGSTAGVAKRNLIFNKNGFLDMYKGIVRVGTNDKFGSHLVFTDSKGIEKIIYIFGFRDKARWKTILGSTLGGGVIDEVNIADEDFVNEVYRALISLDDFWLGVTLNPDNPRKKIYKNLINKSRPLKKWVWDIPKEIIQELKTETKILSFARYWHFNFNDNPAMTKKKIDLFKQMYPEDSFYFQSKVLGIRGVAEGVIFAKQMTSDLISSVKIQEQLKYHTYIRHSIGIDLGNNELKKGTVMTLSGIVRGFDEVHILARYKCKSTETNDLVKEIYDKTSYWCDTYIKNISKLDGVWIDGYGAIQLMIPTIRKYFYANNLRVKIDLCIKFGDDGGRMARMLLIMLLINQKRLLFNGNNEVKELYDSLRKIVYADDGLPLDLNEEHMDDYDSMCYSITPYTTRLNDKLKT